MPLELVAPNAINYAARAHLGYAFNQEKELRRVRDAPLCSFTIPAA